MSKPHPEQQQTIYALTGADSTGDNGRYELVETVEEVRPR